MNDADEKNFHATLFPGGVMLEKSSSHSQTPRFQIVLFEYHQHSKEPPSVIKTCTN